jgi:hypothetical protein
MKVVALNLVKVRRTGKFGPSLVGQWRGEGRKVVFLSELNTEVLKLDGLTVAVRRYIRSINSTFDEKYFYTEVLQRRASSLVKRNHSIVECDEIFDVIKEIQRLRILIAVSLETVSSDFFFVGFVMSVSEKFFSMKLISPLGEAHVEEKIVDIKLVTKIELDTFYLQALSRYLKKHAHR